MPSTDPVLDPSVLESLRAMVGEGEPDLLRELVGIFLRESPTLVQRVIDGLKSGDAEAVERAAHSLKSSAATLGASALSSACRDLELAGRKRIVEDAPARADQIQSLYGAAERALRTLANP